MNQDVYNNLNAAKDKLSELQSAVEAVTYGINAQNRQSKLIDLMAEFGQFTDHLESLVRYVDDGLDELDRLGRENEGLQKQIDAIETRLELNNEEE